MKSKQNLKIVITAAVIKALDFKKRNPKADSEEIIQYMMKHVSEHAKTKIPIMAAISKAISIKESKLSIDDKKIIEMVMEDLDDVLLNIE